MKKMAYYLKYDKIGPTPFCFSGPELLIVLHVILKRQFQQYFQQWQKCWTRYINSIGHCFEGDSNDL
jgi:hypothetical protein